MKLTKSDLREIIKEVLNEYKGIEEDLDQSLRQAHMGLSNAQRDLGIELTNQGHGDAEKIPNAKKAKQQMDKVRREFIKLAKLVKVTSFKP